MKNKKPMKAKAQGNIELSLYDLNKDVISQLPAKTEDELKEISQMIFEFHKKTDHSYYMMLCHQQHYYTLFRKDLLIGEFDNLGVAVVKLIEEMNAQVLAADEFEDRVEIWLKLEDGTVDDYILFPYDRGVVTYGIYK